MGNTLLVFDDFDPISNYKLSLVSEALNIEKSLSNVVFLYHKFKSDNGIFRQDERLALLSASIPNTMSPRYVIDGDSFVDDQQTISQKIASRIKKNKGFYTFILVDSLEYKILEESSDWPYIYSTVQLIVYIRPEDEELKHSYIFTSKNLIFISSSDKLDKLSKASILTVFPDSHPEIVINYMNKSDECAVRRIKSHLSEQRFKHSLRVAGAVKRIMELNSVEDLEVRYDSYLAAVYHDICKEIPSNIQKQIAEDELGINDYASWKILHGPVGAWYMKTNYLFDNEDILDTVAHHTIPGEDPSFMTKCIYLADRLEPGKKHRYPEEVYERAWKQIETQDIHGAFDYLINFFEELKKSNKDREIF